MGFVNTSYTNREDIEVPASVSTKYRKKGILGLNIPTKNAEIATDTTVTLTPKGGTTHKIIYGSNPQVLRLGNDGEWYQSDYPEYWFPRGKQAMANKGNQPSNLQQLWNSIKNFVGYKQQGGTMQQNESIKEKVKALIKMRKDPQKGQQATQILGEFMQQNPEEFKAIVLELAQEDQDVAEFVQELQQASQGGTPMAAKGAKLNYVKELKGICPEGYLKTGGRCKPCEAKMKAKGGDMDPVKSFKNNRNLKKKN